LAGALRQTLLGELDALPQTLIAGFKGQRREEKGNKLRGETQSGFDPVPLPLFLTDLPPAGPTRQLFATHIASRIEYLTPTEDIIELL